MKLRPIGHEDQLSIIDHLDEVRSRLIVTLVALLVVFGLCFWQNHPLLNLLNNALPAAAKSGLGNQPKLDATLGQELEKVSVDMARFATYLGRSRGVNPGAATEAHAISRDLHAVALAYPRNAGSQEKPIVVGVGEGFTTTMLVAAYFAVLFTLPLMLYQVYAFVLPALNRTERSVATPTVISAPLLFVAGAAFTYFAVLPPAVHFLQGFNSSKFQVLIGAGSYYRFEIILMMGIGLAFQVPLLALALQRVGAISSSTLTLNWRYISVLIAVIVAALPGVDPVTMTMETLPLVFLYVLSIALLKWVELRQHRRAQAEASLAATTDPAGSAGDSAGTS